MQCHLSFSHIFKNYLMSQANNDMNMSNKYTTVYEVCL